MRIIFAETYNKYLNNDYVDYTKYLQVPVNMQENKTSALNTCNLILKGTNIATPLRPSMFALLTVDLKTNDVENEYYFVVANDNCTFVQTGYYNHSAIGYYNHNITLVEQTKLLERIVVDNCTFTKPTVKKYSEHTEEDIYFTYNDGVYNYKYSDAELNNMIIPDTYVNNEQITLVGCREFLTNYNTMTGSSLWVPSNDIQSYYTLPNSDTRHNLQGTVSAPYIPSSDLKMTGYYTIILVAEGIAGNQLVEKEVIFKILVLPPDNLFPEYTLNSAIQRLINISRVNYTYEPIDNDFAIPDMSFENKTLRECIDELALLNNSLCQLKGNDISLVPLTNKKYVDLFDSRVGKSASYDIEQYATNLDSTSHNLINMNNSSIEPMKNLYKTVRANGTIRIGVGTNATCQIETEYPIYEFISLKVGKIAFTSGGTEYNVGDISNFVYEKTEYDALSSYEKGIYSKSCAIYWTQYQKGIKGLDFKLENTISPLFENYAIVNILKAKLGVNPISVSTTMILEIPFTIEYKSIDSLRLQMFKTLTDSPIKLSSIYNQGANLVNSEYYGNNLRLAIEKFGNVQEFATFIKPSNVELPQKVGNVYDNKVVYKIDYEFYKNYVKYSLSLSKDYIELPKFIGLYQEKRFYEISIKNTSDRQILLNDFLVISDAIKQGQSYVTQDMLNNIKKALSGQSHSFVQTGVVVNANQDSYKPNTTSSITFRLPLKTYVIGNALIYSFKFADNYSAGNKSVAPTPTGWTYRLNEYANYTDFFGRLKYLTFVTHDEYIINLSMNEQLSFGNKYPELVGMSDINIDTDYESTLIRTTSIIDIDKDSRECIGVNYQLNCITDNEDFIITGNIFNIDTSKPVKLYAYKDKLQKTDTKHFTNDDDILFIQDIDTAIPNISITINSIENTYTYMIVDIFLTEYASDIQGYGSWYLENNGNIILGKNVDTNNIPTTIQFVLYLKKGE